MPKPQPSKPLLSETEPVFTTAPVEVPQGNPAAQPIWIRLPKSGQLCPYTGLSRSSMNVLILGSNPLVKSVSLKKRYAIRGTRLVSFLSLVSYIEGVAAAQNPPAPIPEQVDQQTKAAPSETVQPTQ